ncbi:MAG TPA: glycoside hydrolase family 43 protein [Opitutaceae bacterium]|nr:glycoside hydrolase family 43 protein [Opitutaceae bacterium]
MHHTFSPGRRQSSLLNSAPVSRTLRSNPVLPSPSADPQLSWINGKYYYCESSEKGIFLRVADDFLALAESPQIRVFTPPLRGPTSRNIWAPELHLIDGRCYIYFAADDGDNANHRMHVLATDDANPLGKYTLQGELDTEGWAIDGTVFCDNFGARYFVWSGWAGRVDGQQNLYISRMKSPTELCGGRVLLCTPNLYWERNGLPICEGPQVLLRDGRIFIVYSASASWTSDYCLGMLVCNEGDVMDPDNWRKVGKVFGSNEHAWGVGHCGFITTPQGEDWILYHSKTLRRPGWEDREVRAQPYSWNHYGHPVFGEPRARNRPLAHALVTRAA